MNYARQKVVESIRANNFLTERVVLIEEDKYTRIFCRKTGFEIGKIHGGDSYNELTPSHDLSKRYKQYYELMSFQHEHHLVFQAIVDILIGCISHIKRADTKTNCMWTQVALHAIDVSIELRGYAQSVFRDSPIAVPSTTFFTAEVDPVGRISEMALCGIYGNLIMEAQLKYDLGYTLPVNQKRECEYLDTPDLGFLVAFDYVQNYSMETLAESTIERFLLSNDGEALHYTQISYPQE